MINALSSAASGMRVATLRLDASAGNVANAQTPGYRGQQVVATAQAGGGVEARVERRPEPGVALAEEAVEQMAAAAAFKANLKVLSTVHDTLDQTLGRWLDVKV